LSRLAWFTPLPPARSGIAQYSLELLPRLSSAHEIDVFVDRCPNGPTPLAPGVKILGAHDFLWTHLQRPYDLVVYQMGNAPCHDYMWAYLTRYPGLVVLHDGVLHHARGRRLLQQKRDDDYRAELRFSHPEVSGALADLGVLGMLGSLTYALPMRRVVVDSARLLVVHNHWLADDIRAERPDTPVDVIEMGVPEPVPPAGAATIVRMRHEIPADAVLFTAVGEVTPEKRISQSLRALASIVDVAPVHLLLAGRPVDHYDAQAEARTLGVSDRVTLAGFVPEEQLPEYLAAADVCLCMRWPSSRETSAAWLRCLAAGRPTITTELAHTTDIPALDPRSWKALHANAVVPDGPEPRTPNIPACVSIDIIDEDHSLGLAMRRLAVDARLRATLAQGARVLWAARFSLDRMVAGYLDIIERACALPFPDLRTALPAHLSTNGTERAADLLEQVGVPRSRLADIWRAAEHASEA
jgi:glycosyltransferase involved in cell wall biosynthesis